MIREIVDHIVPMDDKGKRRTSRPAKWYVVLGLVAFSCYAGRDYFNRTLAWFVKVDTHIEVHSPEGYKRLQSLERKVDDNHREAMTEIKAAASDVSEMKGDMRVIRDGLIRRGLADAPTPTPGAWAFTFRGFIPSASADDGVVGPGLPRRLPAGLPAVVAPGHVGKDRR